MHNVEEIVFSRIFNDVRFCMTCSQMPENVLNGTALKRCAPSNVCQHVKSGKLFCQSEQEVDGLASINRINQSINLDTL